MSNIANHFAAALASVLIATASIATVVHVPATPAAAQAHAAVPTLA